MEEQKGNGAIGTTDLSVPEPARADISRDDLRAAFAKCPRLLKMVDKFEGGSPASAPPPALDGRCARCGEYDGAAEPWCEACARDHRVEHGPIFKSWVYGRRERYLVGAGVPPAFHKCGLDNFEARGRDQRGALDAVEKWLSEVFSGLSLFPGLYLRGPVGTGKTHLATGALLEALARKHTARFVAVRELLLQCRESFRRDMPLGTLLDDLIGTNVLLLDDFAAEKPSEFSREVFELLIDRVYTARRPHLVITSNLDLGGLIQNMGERVPDRLRELCMVVRVGGPSYRRRIAAGNASGPQAL